MILLAVSAKVGLKALRYRSVCSGLKLFFVSTLSRQLTYKSNILDVDPLIRAQDLYLIVQGAIAGCLGLEASQDLPHRWQSWSPVRRFKRLIQLIRCSTTRPLLGLNHVKL